MASIVVYARRVGLHRHRPLTLSARYTPSVRPNKPRLDYVHLTLYTALHTTVRSTYYQQTLTTLQLLCLYRLSAAMQLYTV